MSFKSAPFLRRLTIASIALAALLLAFVAIWPFVYYSDTPVIIPSSTEDLSYPVPDRATYSSEQAQRWGGRPRSSEKEYWEGKGALIWFPMIKRVVDEAIIAGVVQPSERTLFESLMLGVVGVEAGGANPFIKRPHLLPGAVSSDGLTQLIRQHLWSNENPFDPLTNLRAGVRTLARYYRGYGNRWDLALVEHSSADVANPIKVSEAQSLRPSSYTRRVVDINQMARRLLAADDLWDDPYYFLRERGMDEVSRRGMASAPPWSIFDPPDLPFNWAPPQTSRAHTLWADSQTDGPYLQRAVAIGIQVRLGHQDDPGEIEPAPSQGDADVMFDHIAGPTFVPRQPTEDELAMITASTPKPAVEGVDYPVGRTAQPPSGS